MQAHPLAELFPMLPERELHELADDMVTFGQRVPITLLDGMILDGRNRYAACRFAKIDPVFAEYDGDDPLNFVLSHNLHRRHLTDSQRAMVAARIVDWENGLNQHSGRAHVPAHKAAERLSISERAVKAARRIQEHGAVELVDAIRDGRLSVKTGEAISHLEQSVQREVLDREEREIIARAKQLRAERQRVRHGERLAHMGRVAENGRASAPGRLDRAYAVYYADPPWKFGVRSEVTGREKSAENHYPTMTTDEIVALLVDLIGGEHPAVFFCWATNPMLLDALRVLQACGFTYVHHWIWDKEVAGTGYWGRDQHELLLIGRRGDVAAPLPGTQPATVHRERKGAHSAKPDFFAEQIEKLYPGVPRIELFCRAPRPGWDVWGFEANPEAATSSRPPKVEAGAAPPPAAPASRPSVTEDELDEWRLLGLVDGGATVTGPAVDEMVERGLIWRGSKKLSLTVGGAERLAELEPRVKAASDGDAVKVAPQLSEAGVATRSIPADLRPADGKCTEVTIGGMRENAGAVLCFRRSGSQVIVTYRISFPDLYDIHDDFNEAVDSFEEAMERGLRFMAQMLGVIAKKADGTHRHKAAANGGIAWIDRTRAKWGVPS